MRKFSVSFAAVCLFTLGERSSAASSTFTWDSGGASPSAPVSASGTWNTSNAFWSNGTTDSAWNNANGDTAQFSGTGNYTVTVGGTISAGGLLFTNTNATIVTLNSSTIALTGSSALIRQTDGGSSMTIGTVLSGTASVVFTVANVTLNSLETYTGGSTTITSGNVRLGISNALPTNTNLTLSGGTLMFINAGANTQTVASLSGNSTGARGVWGRIASGSTLIVNGTSTTTYGGQIINDAGATQNLTVAGSTTLTLTNTTGLTFGGTTTVTGSATLKLGTNANLANSKAVVVSGGALLSTSGTINLGLGVVSMSSGTISAGGISTVGTFVVAANQNLTATGGTIALDLGTASDSILGSGTGTFSLSNTTLALTLGSGFAYGSTYNVFSGFASGSMTNLSITGYDTSNYTAALSNAGVLSFTAVPEPSALALAGAGLLVLAARRRFARSPR